jgi:predicted aldo/keto reductase-like oxidoreductase
MDNEKKSEGINRRTFLKVGMVGTTSALLGGEAIATAVQNLAESGPSVFPKPVYRTLGRTGMKISVVSFGAGLIQEPEVLKFAFDNGVNYVDTARAYMNGRSEEIIAKALKGRRNKIYVATKIFEGSTTKKDIIRDVETSLRTLETDYIDVIQLHSLSNRERIFIAETREALAELKKQGKVRFFGVSTHKNQPEVLHALVDDKDRFFDMVLVAYNFESSKEIGVAIERAAKAKIGIIAMKTQAGGYKTEAMGAVSPHQAALKWVLQNPNISATVPGMKSLAHVRENIAVMGMPFKTADAHILQKYHAAVADFYCDLCGTCEGTCPWGVAISTINRSLMYAEGYRSPALALSTYREVPKSASAAACLDCPVCVAQCARGLNIAARMQQARTLLA